MAAHSGVSVTGDGLVGQGSGNFEAMTLNNASGVPIFRSTDAEYKILDNVADMLGNNRGVSGVIDIFSELKVCASCSGVISQFKAMYPNINVNVVANPAGRVVLKE